MNQQTAHNAYSRANHTVPKTRQVVMLYDGAIRFMKQAIEAIGAKDYETRYHKLTRVSDILVGLQACLDFNAGGEAAIRSFATRPISTMASDAATSTSARVSSDAMICRSRITRSTSPGER